ncbi:MAG: endolytic transglycosylase MltG, partial [Actinomycetia bacterium]|nr:endolytic transglycosylase MltG [Actinomycetes bacterium]
LKTKMSASQALTALADPSTLVNMQFMVSDGQRAAAIVAQISQKTGVPVPDLQAALANPAALGLPAWAQLNGEGEDGNAIQGYLFPETYSYDESPTAQKVLKPLVAQFVKVTDGLDFAAKAQAHGLRPDQAVVLASIVEKEGATSQYAATIAQVFYNRINAGMPLQSDATVLYANNVTGSLTTTDEQRNLNSVYNTYVAPGLPPGPICNPGKIALDAAVNPTAGDYLYFVVTNPATGEVKFASNAADHAKNVAEFQAWCQANPGKC